MSPEQVSLEFLQHRSTSSPSGASCFFVKLDDNIGIKCYTDDGERDKAFKYQQWAAEYGLAPEAYEKYDIGPYECYTTQVADTSRHINHLEMDKLEDELETLFGFFGDMGSNNVGYIGDKLVAIDFGFDSVGFSKL